MVKVKIGDIIQTSDSDGDCMHCISNLIKVIKYPSDNPYFPYDVICFGCGRYNQYRNLELMPNLGNNIKLINILYK